MKFFSEITNTFYDTPEACIAAEAEHKAAEEAKSAEKKRKIEEQEARKAAVDEAFAELEEAKVHYYDLLNVYCADYGFYENKPTICRNTVYNQTLDDLIRKLFS